MTERLWMLVIVMAGAIGILTGVVFQDRNKIQSLEEERSVCSDQREKLAFEASELNQQVIQLKEKQRDTERESPRWNANPRTHPMLIKEFKTQAALDNNEEISGIAKLNEEIFVITSGSNVIERFDSASLSPTRTLTLQACESLEDMQPCNRSQSLFVIEKESTGKRFISNVDPYNFRIIDSWAADSCIKRISVTEDCNVFAACYDENKIIEYSSTGHLIQEIVLDPETGIVHPVFALKMAIENFLVSYCNSGKNTLRRVYGVAIVNSAGDVLKSYSDPLKRTEPVTAIAIDRLGNVLIAELTSGRVLLLSPDLEYARDIVSEEHGTRMIHAMLLDEVNGRLFVADCCFNVDEHDFEDGRILVFDMK